MARASKSTYSKGPPDAALILIAFALGVLSGYALLSVQEPTNTGQLIKSDCSEIADGCIYQSPNQYMPETIESSATIQLPAVDAEGNGAIMPLTVQKLTGNGKTLIDINNLVFWFDTQQSIQTAKSVAQKIAAADTDRINIVYLVNTEADLVGGPSAGAALTIATIAVLKDKELNNSVMITGTINPDGSIGPVGGILDKAMAAKGAGAKLFLVPKGQANETAYETKKICSVKYEVTFCRTVYERVIIEVTKAAGIPVMEISSVEEAEKYFLI